MKQINPQAIFDKCNVEEVDGYGIFEKVEIYTKKPDYIIKNFQSMNTDDFPAFSFNLYDGKKKLGFIIDDGNGGGINYYNLDKKAIHNMEVHAKNLGKDIESFLYDFVGTFEDTKYLKRILKTKVLFVENKVLRETKYKGKNTPEMINRLVGKIQVDKPDATILNTMTIPQAVELYQKISLGEL